MKRKNLNELDTLIIADIKEHPGSTQGQVISRLMAHYQSRTYIQTRITLLVARGFIADERTGQSASLFCI